MDPVVLVDTHVLAWAVHDERRLSRAAHRAWTRATQRLVADISLRELALLAVKGRLAVDAPIADWLEALIEEQRVEVIPVDARIAARSVRLAEDFHGDPADQLIAATAIELDVPLVTADERLRASPAVRTIW